MTMLRINDLCVNYGMLEAVKNVSMEVPEGKVISLLGANGSGKSTILKTISGLKDSRQGEIFLDDTKINGMEIDRIVGLGISLIPEGRRLFPYMSVLENLNLGAYLQSSKAEIDKVRAEVYEHFPMLQERANVRSSKLSGGEQELLSVARALMSRPRMLMMDEPCQGLSPIMVKEISKTIRALNESGLSILLVEHNVSIALGVADHVYILRNGSIVFEGSPTELSADEFTKKIYLAG
jgi:branched-chain amino acid transport system ATP-binding protein|tara:strand:- start:913 stop:1623 length:711 start_codon:yes stop_codon:yes gene_type:complete